MLLLWRLLKEKQTHTHTLKLVNAELQSGFRAARKGATVTTFRQVHVQHCCCSKYNHTVHKEGCFLTWASDLCNSCDAVVQSITATFISTTPRQVLQHFHSAAHYSWGWFFKGPICSIVRDLNSYNRIRKIHAYVWFFSREPLGKWSKDSIVTLTLCFCYWIRHVGAFYYLTIC